MNSEQLLAEVDRRAAAALIREMIDRAEQYFGCNGIIIEKLYLSDVGSNETIRYHFERMKDPAFAHLYRRCIDAETFQPYIGIVGPRWNIEEDEEYE